MLKKFNELSLKDKAYLIGGLSLLVIVISFGLLNRQTVTVSLVFTQLSAPLILVIFTCLVIGIIAGSAIGISYHHNKTQDLRSRIAEAKATINIKDKELVQYEEQVQQLKGSLSNSVDEEPNEKRIQQKLDYLSPVEYRRR